MKSLVIWSCWFDPLWCSHFHFMWLGLTASTLATIAHCSNANLFFTAMNVRTWQENIFIFFLPTTSSAASWHPALGAIMLNVNKQVFGGRTSTQKGRARTTVAAVRQRKQMKHSSIRGLVVRSTRSAMPSRKALEVSIAHVRKRLPL